MMYDRYIGTKYSTQTDLLYFEWDTFIPALEKQVPNILEEIFNCDHQRHTSVHIQSQSIPATVMN